MVLPPDEPLAPPKPKPPPLKAMQGKIHQQAKCQFCPGSFIVITPEGEDTPRIFHSKDHKCAKFDEDPNAYLQHHNTTRKQRRAAKSKRKGVNTRRQGRMKVRKRK